MEDDKKINIRLIASPDMTRAVVMVECDTAMTIEDIELALKFFVEPDESIN